MNLRISTTSVRATRPRVRHVVVPLAAVLALGATACDPAAKGSTAKSAPPPVLLVDHFDRPDGLISNEYAFWSPTARDRKMDPIWALNSGSFFNVDGAGSTGAPDDREPNAQSTNGTDSAIFRLITNESDFTDVAVGFQLRHEGFVSTPSTPPVDWDGVHIFLRYQSEESLYYASVNRRDGTTQIKKKVPGGPDNGGTYYTLASGTYRFPRNEWQTVAATIDDQPDGSVRINLAAGNQLLVSAVDRGVGGPVIRSGAVGIRGDNSRFSVDEFVVLGL